MPITMLIYITIHILHIHTKPDTGIHVLNKILTREWIFSCVQAEREDTNYRLDKSLRQEI